MFCNLKYSLLVVLLLSVTYITTAQSLDDLYPREIKAEKYPFMQVSSDSMKTLFEIADVTCNNNGAFDTSLENICLIEHDDKVSIAVRDNGKWMLSTNTMNINDMGFSLEFVNVDDLDVTGKLLLTGHGTFGKGGRYSGYDYENDMYHLVDVKKEQMFFLKETSYSESHAYTGYIANDTGDVDREDEEYFNDENFESYNDADRCTIKVFEDKVLFDDIVYQVETFESEALGIDTIQSIEYIFEKDRLLRNKILPKEKKE